MFYAMMDAMNSQGKKQQRLEDQQDRIAGLLKSLLDERKTKTSACPKVPATRFCELCCVAGHQVAECRNKAKMDVGHVEHVYKKKGLSKKMPLYSFVVFSI
ncbi:unnamed protein product [Strongylus vulgaris]|uniref:Uncharacterized protein n=1 Tax=Strongylus vulgaris TaxID=40348 RepID=A0A3P7IWM8_STRVU|nr:unnamed protein product [Strongylus vulgaris]